jgi:hypothetical protein
MSNVRPHTNYLALNAAFCGAGFEFEYILVLGRSGLNLGSSIEPLCRRAKEKQSLSPPEVRVPTMGSSVWLELAQGIKALCLRAKDQ